MKFDITNGEIAMDRSFDLVFENPLNKRNLPPVTIGKILFDKLPHRNEECNIILSHFENNYIEISLQRFRYIVSRLLISFERKQILKGQTVIVLTFNGCNEMITALFFIALATRGCRTFMPMYSESEEFSGWIDQTKTEHVILPLNEVLSLDGHDREKSEIREIEKLVSQKKINIWDTLQDFGISEMFTEPFRISGQEDLLPEKGIEEASPGDDVLIVTTSGSSGRSRLVVYSHEAYFFNCLSWEQAGFYRKEILGGHGFTPLLTHTMGIRALINALWTGSPVCLIITEWFISKPETVRYLLLKMMPEHITGGPAVYNIFLELFRVFPEIKTLIGSNLKTLVSSGAEYDPVTATEVFNATGLRLNNAFGTTETQQIFSTLLSSSSVFRSNMIPLGDPLPGVKIGLVKVDQKSNHFRLHVKSLFGHKYCIGGKKESNGSYFDTGDIICLDENTSFLYVRRASLDYFKDSFGVKIPVLSVKEYYKNLLETVLHGEFYPVKNFPGLAALLFIRDSSLSPGSVTDSHTLKKFRSNFEEINNRLINTIEPFEYQHRHVCRIAVVNESPPRTGKGTISVKQINSGYCDLIGRLTDSRKESAGIESTDSVSYGSSKYAKYLSPQIGTFLSALKLNYQYEYGVKDSLFTHICGKEVEVLDVTGGYGTNLLGHNNQQITEAIQIFLSERRIAICNQLSIQDSASLLAEKLNLFIGSQTRRSYQVILGSTGSEAVEIAIHHAYFEWEKRIETIKEQQFQVFASDKNVDIAEVWQDNTEVLSKMKIRIIAVTDSFHGHTTGARSILGHLKKRSKFSRLTNIEAVFIDDREKNWCVSLANTLEESSMTIHKVVHEGHEVKIIPFKISSVIAAIAEPVIGEGGVRVVSDDFLRELSLHEFPLISDEIQCGLGRTGDLPACRYAHYYLFGKALGGGIEKISAVMIDKSRFCFNFSEYYTSTFGNGELAAVAGLKTIEIIESGNLTQTISETGCYLKEKLLEIRNHYPDILSDVSGKGLMLAISFNPESGYDNLILRILFEKEKAGYLFSAWLLNRHRIRMFPTLSAPDKLRIEPSAYLSRSECDTICKAIEELCLIVREKKMYDLFSFLMDDDPFVEEKKDTIPDIIYNQILETPTSGAVKTAFIAHFAFPLKELRMLVPDFNRASDTGLRIFFNRLQILMDMEALQMLEMNLFNGRIHFSFWVIPLDSSELEFLHKSGMRKQIVTKIQKAVNVAAENGAKVISLGGFNSILTNNGLSLVEPKGSRIITGNTLTAATGLAHLRNTIKKTPEFNKPNIIAIIGATGNIGQVITEILSEQQDICSQLILLSRSEKRLNGFANSLKNRMNSSVNILTTSNIFDVRDADVIVVCSNTNDPILFPHHIAGDKPVLISDLSVPSAVSQDVTKLTNVTTIPFSSYVTLPEDKNAVISSYSPQGTIFCCAAEAIILGLDRFPGALKGRILPEEVKMMTALAEKNGFLMKMGNMSSFKARKI